MSAASIVNKIMANVPKAVAAGVVDMETGMLMDVRTVDTHPQDILDLVAAATKDLFEGDNVTAIEDTFKRNRGVKTDERYFKQIIVLSTNLLHVFSRLSGQQSMVAVVVCRADANIGLALMKVREICSVEMV